MRVSDSSVKMSGKSSFTEIDTKEESISLWIGSGSNSPTGPQDQLSISEEGKGMLSQFLKAESGQKIDEDNPDSLSLSDKDRFKIQLIEEFIRALTGKRIKIRVLDQSEFRTKDVQLTAQAAPVQPRQGWGLIYNYRETHIEKATMNFSSEGRVITADGREINFSVEMNMSREFMSQASLDIRAGDARKTDPLVINFNGSPPALSSTKYSFDLDCDGKPEQISFLTPGSGFLALDANNDGRINNGSELFGPRSGDGFADLAQYDSDGNNWIDENDPIFDKLRIWSKDEKGNDRLVAIGQMGIGAIYLGNVDTSFGLKNSDNALLGQIQKTGIFLKEDGGAGTIQHIDLTI